MIELRLREAFPQEGCPICRLRQQSEARTLANILWEGVMDVGFRIRFVNSEGLCLQHAWELHALALTSENEGFGTGILYDALLKIIRQRLAEEVRRDEPPPWWHPARWRRQAHRPAQTATLCPVCAGVQQTEETYSMILAELLQEREWQDAYIRSNGVCLPHLRQLLAAASPTTAKWLLAQTEPRMDQLQHELREYLRKHAYQYAHESMTDAERSSWVRAIAFLRGERPHSREDDRANAAQRDAEDRAQDAPGRSP